MKYPGLHLRKLCRELNIPKTTLEYNLRYLEKQGLITVKSERKYLWYYATKKVGNIDKKVLSILRQDIPRKIILFLFLYPRNSRIELSKDIKKSPTTIGYHLTKLLNMNIIERERSGHKTVYKIKRQREIYKLFITYEKSFLSDITFSDLLNWARYAYTDGMPKRDPNSKTTDVEDVYDALIKIFPHPYHG